MAGSIGFFSGDVGAGEIKDFHNGLEADVNNIIKEFKRLQDHLAIKELEKILRKGGRDLRDKVKEKIRSTGEGGIKSKHAHWRYKDGEKVEQFHPGNLERSIKVMKGKVAGNIFVGPKIKRGSAIVVDRDTIGNANGYYAHFVEFGTAGSRVYEDRTFVTPEGKFMHVKKGTHIKGQKPQPYMRPTWELNKTRLNKFFADELTKKLAEFQPKQTSMAA